MINAVHFARRIGLLSAVAPIVVMLTAPASADAPRQLYNKTIEIGFTVNQVARTVDGQPRSGVIAVKQAIYVSSAGRLFTRSSRANGSKSGQSEMAPGAGQNKGGEATGIRFQGNQLVSVVAFAQGARQFIVTFDNGFSSCKVAVSFGRDDGGGMKRVGVSGEMLTIESMKASGESCTVKDGNSFAPQ